MSRRTTSSGRAVLGRYDYPTRYRLFEVASLMAFALCDVAFAARLTAETVHRLDVGVALGLALSALGAFLAADLLSGVVHFLCDNLGTADTALVGRKFIKSFRDHHDDPQAMTQGDFVTVNADNASACLPVLVPTAVWLDIEEHFFLASFLALLMVFIVLTNEVHRWAHMSRVPAVVRRLQAGPLMLSPQHHQRHHTAPFDSHYCITSGVLNPVLERVHLWPALLRVFGGAAHTSSARPAGGS